MTGWISGKTLTFRRRNRRRNRRQDPPNNPPNNPPVIQTISTDPDPELVTEGFPSKVSEAFQKAADELNCVIWSRVPGKACTTLIDEGYNLKPFYVHGKSCNWGPMAGFVCQLPVFNKGGVYKMDYNLKEHLNSLERLKEKKEEGRRNWKNGGKTEFLKILENGTFQPQVYEERLSVLVKKEDEAELNSNEKKELDKLSLRWMSVANSLFLPLSISDKRKKELTNSEDFLGKININYREIRNDLVIGVAQYKYNENKTVLVEYLMKKRSDNSNLWDIYHRNIYIKEIDAGYHYNYLKKEGSTGFTIPPNPIHNDLNSIDKYNQGIQASIDSTGIKDPGELGDREAINTGLEGLLNGLLPKSKRIIVPAGTRPLEGFYPVNGIQSPYLAYQDEANLYKNAVSGDYDLFAVWPFTPNASFEMTTRISELQSKKSASDKIQQLFIPVEAKANAVEFTKSRNVFIEFIGTYQELKGKEDPEDGNISDLVRLTAQTLNSLVQTAYNGNAVKGPFPNRTFHGDEGGRPEAPELEYPIAFFMPSLKSLLTDLSRHDSENRLTSTAFLVKDHVQFISLIKLLRRQFYVFLHDAWVTHLMCLAADNEIPNTNNVYLQARIEERATLRAALGGSLESIRSPLMDLLTPLPPNPENAAETRVINDAFNRVIGTFINLASQERVPPLSERRSKVLEAKIEMPEMP